MHPLDAFGDPLANVLGWALVVYVGQAFARAAWVTWRERQLARSARSWHARMKALGEVTQVPVAPPD